MNEQDDHGAQQAVDARLLAQLVQRAGSAGFERWWARVADSGFCTAPVHLTGTDPAKQQLRVLARCKNRRATVCPSCSRLYAGDTWQLVHRGLTDNPETGQVRPAVFVTLTAPSFGPVHRIGACHPHQRGRCPHDRPRRCGTQHRAGAPLVGSPLCGECYDYPGHVLFSWHAPELWHRFTITLRRNLRRALRDREAAPNSVRLSYVKIVELQQRGIPHYHAVVRLDPTGEHADSPLTATDLAALITRAAGAARLRVPGAEDDAVSVRFGTQVDVQPLDLDTTRGRAVAGYLAKYVTKSVADLGLTHRRLSPAAIDRLDLDEHVRRILHTIIDLAAHSERAEMLRWLHTLGYRGHVSSKTRHYSTTMTALRAQRASWHQTERDDDTPPVEWQYTGNGHATDGDRLLAASAAHRAIEQQQAAREAIRDQHGESA